jgi:hypothetical protein
MSPPKLKKPRDLVLHDWHFSDCPPDELPVCFRYEYCRESKMKDIVLRFRARQKEFQSAFDEAGKIINHIATHPQLDANDEEKQAMSLLGMSYLMFDWFAYIPDFPDRPWLDLPKDTRTEYIKTIMDAGRIIEPAFGLRIVTGAELEKFAWSDWQKYRRSWHPDAIQGWFEIPAGLSQKEVLKQFDNYLQSVSKEHPTLFSTKPGGRNGPKDKLNQLGAYRILCGRSAARAAKYVSQKNLHLYDEDKETSWYRARDAAALQIMNLDKLACDWLGCFKAIR